MSRNTQFGYFNSSNLRQILVNLPNFIRLYWRLFKDTRVPVYLKAILLLAVAYVISPIDLIPDWIVPIIGEIDDAVIFIFALRYFVIKSPQAVVWEHVREIESSRKIK